jgi:ElaB/YqjD/DUF883 family membrane-anchored ribosome-binding protein
MSIGLWNARKDVEGALSAQIETLQDELRTLRRMASKRGAQSYSDARDSAADLVDEIRDILAATGAQLGRRARHAGETVKSNPAAAAAVGLVVLGLVASLFAGRASRR